MLDYPPPPSAPLVWFVQRNHVWKTPSSTFHQNLELPGLPQPVSRSKGRKCARLSAPSLCATVLVCSKEPPSSTFHQNLELPGLLQPVSRSKGRKCARLSAPSLCATVLVCFKGPMYGKPQRVPFTRTLNCQDCPNEC